VNGSVETLPIVMLDIQSRCNCRCIMCDIWKQTESRHMTAGFVRGQLDDLRRLRVEWAVLTGGEPLMNGDVFEICRLLRAQGIRVTILTSGLLVGRYAVQIVDHVDDLIVSLDGPEAVHDRIRGVPGCFSQLADGIRSLRRADKAYRISGRCTVQRSNHDRLTDTVETAEALELSSISFLAADIQSPAFNRPEGWDALRRERVTLDRPQVPVLADQVSRLIAGRTATLADTDDHLNRIVDIFRSYAGLAEARAPRCNAPWVSAVLDSAGAVSPCFFHRPFADASGIGLAPALNAPAALRFRTTLDVAADETCKSCVCSLNRQ